MTWAATAVTISAIGLASSTYAAVSNASNQKKLASYQANVDQNNAQIAQWQASDAEQRGAQALQAQQLQQAALKGRQRAELAANNVDLGSGSALNILTSSDVLGAMDQNTTKNNTAKEAWALRNQAQGYTDAANAATFQADNTSPGFAAAGSLLSGAGSLADKWYNYTDKLGKTGGGV